MTRTWQGVAFAATPPDSLRMNRRDFLSTATASGAALALAGWPLSALAAPRPLRPGGLRLDFDRGWQFARAGLSETAALAGDAAWTPVTLPHTAKVEALVTGPPGSDTYQWQGTSWYRKPFSVPAEAEGQSVWLRFEGAMNVADVWLDGEYLGRHLGGWTPFGLDLTDRVRPGAEHVLAVRLDNTDNALTGPKPLADLDFNYYGGLYRNVHLVVKDRLHITDPVLADKVASGGVFARTLAASAEEAEEWVQVHVANTDGRPRTFAVRAVLEDADGHVAAEATSAPVVLAPGSETEVVQTLRVVGPRLWSPTAPHLYTLRAEVVEAAEGAGRVVDAEETRVGLRTIEMSPEGFRINGEAMFLRGTNRHQELPYVGYALSGAAQWRDAKRIKDAGFDYVRLSHYLHDPAFMDACDALGLVVMDCIPGWQYFDRESEAFAALQLENCRTMIRRDRNHPCVILWEVSLNESWMTDAFIEASHRLAHEEYPGDQCYTCGWTRGYDVFIQARQHGGCEDVTDIACAVSEYGDWEYYAQNAGLDQSAWADLAPDAANSRQLRWHGERALLQQATNFQEAHNDNRKTIAFADGLWVMFDYNRGYAPDVESSGTMDLFRLPKFSYYLFQSQRDPSERYAEAEAGPMAFAATYWTPDSPTDVRVFSNCDEVELRLNGRVVARQRPDDDRISTHLAHPPFTFSVGAFEPGTLEAVGYLGGRAAARHTVRTPGAVARLALSVDESGRPFAVDGKDQVLVHARLLDAHGTLVPDAWENVTFGVTGEAEAVGTNPYSSEAGVASALVQTEVRRPRAAVYALAVVAGEGEARVLHAGAPLGGDVEPMEVRVTTDGSAPTAASPRYTGPLASAERVRAALLVGGRIVATADSAAERFRVAGSVAPVATEDAHD